MQKLLPYATFKDERGRFLGITQDPWGEVNFIETRSGHTRGNHYHKETRELFFIISGEIEVSIEDVRTGNREEFVGRKGDMFVVDIYEKHTFFTKSDSRWINMLSQPIDADNPDFHTSEQPG
ncbi:MAG TPA: cupin domain-containing protein [Proteobacteria bacterium]|nr:cupin domain-containing protein [Pseudomonadota bacterium]